ncbi:MAG: hypothetical protein Q8862_10300 [Bacteroidota bacterium]|nr:hypothetical protein [Bacteroidota bacterium]MDP4204784.1 hypothetical protein [Bacteroidota bacterium]
MEQDKLREALRSMFALRNTIQKKSEDDLSFDHVSRKQVIDELDRLIEYGLEEFYRPRTV